jgi:shikimate kinase
MNREHVFVPRTRFNPDDVVKFAPRKKMRRLQEDDQQPLFTLEELKRIVAKVVEQREATLRDEFTDVLQERLQEQFCMFSQFNQDYISRQFRNDELSYLN